MTDVIHLTAHLSCDASKAFEMFTVSKLLESWLIAPYSEGGYAEVEPVQGGKYELFWDPTNKENNSTSGCRITAIEPGKFLAFDWKGPVQFKHFMNTADPLTHVVVFFIPNGHGLETSTEVHLVHSGWGNSSEWQEARDYFRQAWSSAFQKLEKEISG